MGNDISYIYDKEKGHSDIQIVDNDIYLGDELRTSIEFSMFSDARTAISPETNIQNAIDLLGGWWADSFEDEPLGSEAWIYDRAKITNETINGLSETYTNSIKGLVDDGVAEIATVTASRSTESIDSIIVEATIKRPQEQAETFKWAFAWGDIENAV